MVLQCVCMYVCLCALCFGAQEFLRVYIILDCIYKYIYAPKENVRINVSVNNKIYRPIPI